MSGRDEGAASVADSSTTDPLHGQARDVILACWQMPDEGAQRRLVCKSQPCDEDGAFQRRSRTQRHRARKHMRLMWRGYHLAKGGVHPPGLHTVSRESVDVSGTVNNREYGAWS